VWNRSFQRIIFAGVHSKKLSARIIAVVTPHFSRPVSAGLEGVHFIGDGKRGRSAPARKGAWPN
jgi:hypothetical protein